MKIKIIIGMFAAMWICAACEKVEIINESDRDENEGVKEIVMLVVLGLLDLRIFNV